jgi:hypothetical protein
MTHLRELRGRFRHGLRSLAAAALSLAAGVAVAEPIP